MAGKATPKVKNGVNKQEPVISMVYIDDILLRLEKAEDHIETVLNTCDELEIRTGKVESRLGLG